jgi:signal transduction histidine kinase
MADVVMVSMLNRLKIGTKIGASFAEGVALFAAFAAIAYRSTDQLIETSKREKHTYEVLAQLENIKTHILNAETGQRGFLITGDNQYLEPYNQATQELNQSFAELQRLTNDNPSQQKRLGFLGDRLNDRLTRMQAVINVRRQQGFAAAQQNVRTNQGKRMMDDIRRMIAEIEAEERRLLEQRSIAASAAAQNTINSIIYGIPLYSMLLILIGIFLSRNISRPLRQISTASKQVGAGDLSVNVQVPDRQDEIGVLSSSFNQMVNSLRQTNRSNTEQNWLKSNLAEFTQMLQGQREQAIVARKILSFLAPLVNAQQGVFYLLDSTNDSPILKLLSSYAHQERKHLGNQFRLGEGLVGQCALEQQRILLTDAPPDYIRITSGLGEAPPVNIIVLPVLFETQTIAVIELASFQPFSPIHLNLLDQVAQMIGIVLNTIAADMRTAQLLEEAQALTEELQQQQAELQNSNRKLEEQTNALRVSEALLKEQQEELQQTNEELQQLNEELEEKAELLASQKQEVETKNQAIEQARQELEEKAQQLALSSKYKSEFLANMSHELRTPLNSLLILARLLSENNEHNLTDKQVECSQTIYTAGTDLLALINDILNLAKIESGTISIEIEAIKFVDIQALLDRSFRQLAQERNLEFTITLDPNLPSAFATDSKRLQQILKNLLANAFKFTEHGSVTLTIFPTTQALPAMIGKDATALKPAIAFAVSDTGIGISPDKQKIIFEAFQQADGTTSRKYGGTGLGLSISRELANLLGGTIDLVSQVGQGSTFTLYLPVQVSRNQSEKPAEISTAKSPTQNVNPTLEPPRLEQHQTTLLTALPANDVSDDRDQIQPSDRVLLVIEDDINFARILLDMARQQGFKVLAALRSKAGLALAQEFIPDAIMLDIRLPDMDGWTVLDRLKHKDLPDLR